MDFLGLNNPMEEILREFDPHPAGGGAGRLQQQVQQNNNNNANNPGPSNANPQQPQPGSSRALGSRLHIFHIDDILLPDAGLIP
jgi:hypothetical protein